MFLDRDGTIAEEVGYLNHVSQFRLFPFVAEAVHRLNEAGMAVVVVTNQSGVGRGYFPESLVHEVHAVMKSQFEGAGARIDGVYFCPHTPADCCTCRKPRTGLLERAASEHGIDVKRSFVVGDRRADIELAHNAGAFGILVRTGYGEDELAGHTGKWVSQPEHISVNVAEAIEWILERSR